MKMMMISCRDERAALRRARAHGAPAAPGISTAVILTDILPVILVSEGLLPAPPPSPSLL